MKMNGLDFETYGSVDLPTHGLDRYISDPHFQPLIATIVWEDSTAEVFDFVDDYTESRLRLIECIGDNTIVAHNAGFEFAVTHYRAKADLGIDPPPAVAFEDANLSPMAQRFYAECKRVSNAHAKAALGWRPEVPTYREGLRDCLTKAMQD